jgi:hypothetical protein
VIRQVIAEAGAAPALEIRAQAVLAELLAGHDPSGEIASALAARSVQAAHDGERALAGWLQDLVVSQVRHTYPSPVPVAVPDRALFTVVEVMDA